MEAQVQKKKSILSGIQPTGVFTLGNYIGAVKNWAPMQDEFDCAYMIADLHAITVRQEPNRRRALSLSRATTPTMPSWAGCLTATPSLANSPG